MSPVLEQERKLVLVKWFDDIGIDDVPEVGGKNASLGAKCRELGGQGMEVPDGFAITAEAYRHFLAEAGLAEQIAAILAGLERQDVAGLRAVAILEKEKALRALQKVKSVAAAAQ